MTDSTPSTLSASEQRVQEALHRKGLDCTVVVLSDSAKTAEMAAAALGCAVSQIVKSLIFKTKVTHKPVLALVSGSNRVNEKVLEAHVGEPIIKADADFTREITGFAIGGIPPLGHAQKIDAIFIDEDLLTFDDVWAAAGTPHAVFNFKSSDLVMMTEGHVVAVK